jgi:hypothetical protein
VFKWSDSPRSGLSNDGRARFVALGLRCGPEDEGTRFGLLWPRWLCRIWSSAVEVSMSGIGLRSSIDWWCFRKDWVSFEKSMWAVRYY